MAASSKFSPQRTQRTQRTASHRFSLCGPLRPSAVNNASTIALVVLLGNKIGAQGSSLVGISSFARRHPMAKRFLPILFLVSLLSTGCQHIVYRAETSL